MKKIRIKIQNIKRGDVFVADCDGSCVIVERPRTNMDKEFQAKHRNALRRQRYAMKKMAKLSHEAATDKIMEQLNLIFWV